ncbi:hypothetical protein LTR08_002606 [Meristemomyces frigidus]|nr:hypothetical protein LTR08_002606 [Meristemomyces frigidus]
MAEVGGRNNAIGDFVRTLREDRMIQIYVGAIDSDTKPYLVPQSLLETRSKYFAKALQQDAFREGHEGCLKFPNDDSDAWEVLLFWMIKNTLPDTQDNAHTMILCWVLGDKYAMPVFQDHAMLELLRTNSTQELGFEALKLALSMSAPGSKLRKLVAEELVYLANDRAVVDWGSLETMIDGMGILGDYFRAQERYHKDNYVFHSRLTSSNAHSKKQRAVWTDYMVGEAPAKHWIYDG